MEELPDIKPVVNKDAEPKREKKNGGFFARFFGREGASVFGGAGEGLSGTSAGGLLATKAGLMAMILVGASVAAGVGLVGYRLFGPGSEMTGDGDNLQLFARKPPAAKSDGTAPQDGSSASLQYLSQANAVPAPEKTAKSETSDAPSAGGGSDPAPGGTAAAASGPLNKAGTSGNGVAKGLMKSSANFGALSTSAGGGGGAAVSVAAAQRPASDDAANKGSLSGFKRPTAVAAATGASRPASNRNFKNAATQGFGVLRDNKGATSSYSAGRTYDGAAAGGSITGPTGGEIGSGSSVETGAAQQKSTPGPATDTKKTQVPTPSSTDEAPWQNSIKTAEVLLALGGVLLFAMSKLGKVNPIIFYALNAVVGLVAAAIIAIGAQISGGKYGQKLQGEVLAAAGAGLMLGAGMAAFEGPSSGTEAKSSSGGLSGINPYVLVGGGAALIGLAASMMIPLKKYPSSDFKDGNAPDSHWFGLRRAPANGSLLTRTRPPSDGAGRTG